MAHDASAGGADDASSSSSGEEEERRAEQARHLTKQTSNFPDPPPPLVPSPSRSTVQPAFPDPPVQRPSRIKPQTSRGSSVESMSRQTSGVSANSRQSSRGSFQSHAVAAAIQEVGLRKKQSLVTIMATPRSERASGRASEREDAEPPAGRARTHTPPSSSPPADAGTPSGEDGEAAAREKPRRASLRLEPQFQPLAGMPIPQSVGLALAAGVPPDASCFERARDATLGVFAHPVISRIFTVLAIVTVLSVIGFGLLLVYCAAGLYMGYESGWSYTFPECEFYLQMNETEIAQRALPPTNEIIIIWQVARRLAVRDRAGTCHGSPSAGRAAVAHQ